LNRILLELLRAGQLPVYDVSCPQFYVYDTHGWVILGNAHKIIVSTNIDTPLTMLIDELPTRFTDLPDEPGTLIFAIRFIGQWDNLGGFLDGEGGIRVLDRYGVLIIAGLVFCPGVELGQPLAAGDDPTYIIEQACLGLAGRPFDGTQAVFNNRHPALRPTSNPKRSCTHSRAKPLYSARRPQSRDFPLP